MGDIARTIENQYTKRDRRIRKWIDKQPKIAEILRPNGFRYVVVLNKHINRYEMYREDGNGQWLTDPVAAVRPDDMPLFALAAIAEGMVTHG